MDGPEAHILRMVEETPHSTAELKAKLPRLHPEAVEQALGKLARAGALVADRHRWRRVRPLTDKDPPLKKPQKKAVRARKPKLVRGPDARGWWLCRPCGVYYPVNRFRLTPTLKPRYECRLCENRRNAVKMREKRAALKVGQ